jgi:hypothetical protein
MTLAMAPASSPLSRSLMVRRIAAVTNRLCIYSAIGRWMAVTVDSLCGLDVQAECRMQGLAVLRSKVPSRDPCTLFTADTPEERQQARSRARSYAHSPTASRHAPHYSSHRPRQQQQQQQGGFFSDPFSSMLGMHMGNMGMLSPGNGGTSYSYSSSYVSSSGPGGVTYESTSSTRRGPGGVSILLRSSGHLFVYHLHCCGCEPAAASWFDEYGLFAPFPSLGF